jgi:hypothetical protein
MVRRAVLNNMLGLHATRRYNSNNIFFSSKPLTQFNDATCGSANVRDSGCLLASDNI